MWRAGLSRAYTVLVTPVQDQCQSRSKKAGILSDCHGSLLCWVGSLKRANSQAIQGQRGEPPVGAAP